MTTFVDIQTILNDALERWRERVGTPPQIGIHSDGFGWSSKEQILQATAFGMQLIDPNYVGNGQGHMTNLVLSLRTGVPAGAGFWPRMPKAGPFISDANIQVIEDWINEGTPD
ncbi:hypothetical protein ABIF65_011668 [Bradyrhizobium japonicum]|uniref:hypothetical protein n=1 Tax=Bradyrhizobium liaoningense TaxID=43992 RepID=UPI001BAD33F7|nr:hypothetical protein [Bradyrhizobium liaoningense]MBR1070770.1 hypothetical protein [Bradyrhizobium liaoningense]